MNRSQLLLICNCHHFLEALNSNNFFVLFLFIFKIHISYLTLKVSQHFAGRSKTCLSKSFTTNSSEVRKPVEFQECSRGPLKNAAQQLKLYLGHNGPNALSKYICIETEYILFLLSITFLKNISLNRRVIKFIVRLQKYF